MTGVDDTEPAVATADDSGPRPPVRHVRLDHELDRKLRAEHGRTGAPASEIIRRALAAYLT